MRISDYPFTEEATEYVRQSGYSLESLLEKSSFKPVWSRAVERVRGAIDGEIPDKMSESEAGILAELLSYPLARVMVSCLGDDLLARRYALVESKLTYKRLQKEKNLEDLEILADDLGLHPKGSEPWKIHFAEYIRAAHRMHSPRWKLVNRDLKSGFLTITREEMMRLMEEAVRDRVMKGLPLDVGEEVCTSLEEYLKPLKSELDALRSKQKIDLGRVEEGAFPPCIRKMLSDVSKGSNLAHSARFALVSFLLQIGMSIEQVVSLFNTSPDFDAERTRYQVEHIAGSSGTKYRPPACSTMATYGNCPGEDDLCRRVRHPLGYYERRLKFAQFMPPKPVISLNPPNPPKPSKSPAERQGKPSSQDG